MSLRRAPRTALEGIAVAAVAALVVLPLADLVAARLFWKGIAGASSIANHAVLVLAFVSAGLASLDRRHLALASPDPEKGRLAAAALAFADLMASLAQAAFFWAALAFVPQGFSAGSLAGFIPAELFAAAMPLGYLVMCAAMVGKPGLAASRRWASAAGLALGSLLASSSIRNLAAVAFGSAPPFLDSLAQAAQLAASALAIPLILAFVLAAFLGAPIFCVLGGVASILFAASGSFLELAPSEAYSLLRGGSIAPIPLFALVGFLLAETGAGKRLIAVLSALFGWIRGGEAVVAVLACAFFTTFTGANGITILALGGLLAAALVDSGEYPEDKARGLVAASGTIGLLLPPSAAVIVYGINAQFIYSGSGGFDVVSLFKGALVPGLALVAAMCAAGVLAARKREGPARRPSLAAAAGALKPAALELLVPLLAIVLYFTGMAGLTEVGAACLAYIALVETLAKRELGLKGLFSALAKSLPVLGGTLIILASARALSYYVIDANLPAAFAAWVTARISSRFVFLMALNVLLLVVGCLMDIYSAILVVAPLLIPLASSYGIGPVHFGVVFIMNLCIGFLTPPVGMNLFLASYAFKKPVGQIVRDTLPYLAVQFAVLLLATYAPGLSTLWK
ncbi:MAG TPA: TRAP transporter large permease subunit [Spirochaetales bacterium]|nr:TRAP transporter large permease subunit [Spirochaetales bacterium]HRY55650.1 TRAP transporter large permease subunit [Spirochaetia bacterium]HRZ63532.1 TRAP transporter large permease subunit [Spirochaetia bacterium]